VLWSGPALDAAILPVTGGLDASTDPTGSEDDTAAPGRVSVWSHRVEHVDFEPRHFFLDFDQWALATGD